MQDRVYINNWLEFKPYSNQVKTDFYYLKIANNIKSILDKSLTMSDILSDEHIVHLSCIITSYFEDIISEANIWNTFTRLHYELYNKFLPFYPSDDELYYSGEINMQDVMFLIWYYLNTFQNKDYYTPHSIVNKKLSGNIFKILEEEYEYAPENNDLKKYFTVAEDEKNYYIIREAIDSILFKSYLFSTDTKSELDNKIYNILEKHKGENPNQINAYITDARENGYFFSKTKLLALSGKEWLAEIIGTNHPLYFDILNLSKKEIGFFFYKGKDDNYIFLEHIASGEKINLLLESYPNQDSLTKIDTILLIGIVKWRDEFWFSGVSSTIPFDEKLIKNEKKSGNTLGFENEHNNENQILKMQFDTFLEFNNGNQIAFMKSNKITKFSNDFIRFYNTKLQDKDLKEDYTDEKSELSNQFDIDAEECLVFFNPISGIEIAFNVVNAFNLPNNQFYNPKNTDQDFKFLLMEKTFSKELVEYCINNCKDDIEILNTKEGEIVLENLDFLLRFLKVENYYSKPNITTIDSSSK